MSAAALETYRDANPFGSTVTLEEITDNLQFLDDWEARYGYIIDLGRDLPALDDSLRTAEAVVQGCQSQLWMHLRRSADDQVEIAADSDALIVRGLIAIVMAALNRKSPAQAAGLDMEQVFGKLDLLSHLSPMRGNGLRSLVAHVQQTAARL